MTLIRSYNTLNKRVFLFEVNMEEIWKDVVGYEDYFRVSESGKIFSKRTKKELNLTIGKTGYKQFSTRFGGRKGKAKLFKVHILVCEAFNGPRPNAEQKYALHWDDDKLNNHYTNLRWGSLSENSHDAIRNGVLDLKRLIAKGEENPSSKLNNLAVLDIVNNFNNLEIKKREDKIKHYMGKYRDWETDRKSVV